MRITMKAMLLFVFLLSLPMWAQNINAPANVSASQLTVPYPTAYVGGTIVNQTTFGVFPGLDASLWNNSPNRIGGHLSKTNDEGNGSKDEFLLDIESTMDSSNLTLPSFKGPLFVGNINNDTSNNTNQNSGNAITYYSHVGGGNTAAYTEGIVGVTDLYAGTPVSNTHISETSTTVTVTSSLNPGAGNSVNIKNSSIAGYNGSWAVTGSNSSTYTFTAPPGLSTCSSSCGTSAVFGNGYLIGGEFDLNNFGTDVNGGLDLGGCAAASTNCKFNIFLGSGGTHPNSWMMIGSNGGPGFHNGLGLAGMHGTDGVQAGGIAIDLPNNAYIDARTANNANDVILMHLDTLNQLELAAGYPTVVSTNILSPLVVQVGGSANHAICWKPDGKTLGYCSQVVASDGTCGTCN